MHVRTGVPEAGSHDFYRLSVVKGWPIIGMVEQNPGRALAPKLCQRHLPPVRVPKEFQFYQKAIHARSGNTDAGKLHSHELGQGDG